MDKDNLEFRLYMYDIYITFLAIDKKTGKIVFEVNSDISGTEDEPEEYYEKEMEKLIKETLEEYDIKYEKIIIGENIPNTDGGIELTII